MVHPFVFETYACGYISKRVKEKSVTNVFIEKSTFIFLSPPRAPLIGKNTNGIYMVAYKSRYSPFREMYDVRINFTKWNCDFSI